MSYSGRWNDGPCYVYALVDPRAKEIFYIGISISPEARLNGHCNDPCSSAYNRIWDLRYGGLDVQLEIISEHRTRDEAFLVEWRLINWLPGLVNKDRGRRKVFNYGAAA